MMGQNTQLPSAGACSYEQALSIWENIKPVRGRADSNVRPLGRRTNQHLTIRKDTDNVVIVRLYRTDVLTYLPDNTLMVDLYPSRLTSRLVSGMLRSAPYTFCHTPDPAQRAMGVIQGRDTVFYHTPDYALVDLSSTKAPIGGARPFKLKQVDRKQSKLAREEYGYDQFRLWFMTCLKLGADPRGRYCNDDPSFIDIDLLKDGPKGWGELASRYLGSSTNPEASLDALRVAIYRRHGGVHTTKEVDSISGWCSYEAARRRMT